MDVLIGIRELDLGWLEERLMRAHQWPLEHAHDVCEEYKKFLALKRLAPSRYETVPSSDVDHAWHHHILDTRRYAEDCQVIFGAFLHHDPGLTGEVLQRAWAATLNAYFEHFGDGAHPLTLDRLWRLATFCG